MKKIIALAAIIGACALFELWGCGEYGHDRGQFATNGEVPQCLVE